MPINLIIQERGSKMNRTSFGISLLKEEKRSAVWFTWLFYTVFVFYDILTYYLLPIIPWTSEFADNIDYNLHLVKQLIILGLIPFLIYLIKNNKPHYVKYILFCTYISINFILDIVAFWESDQSFSAGNLVELVFILFSPIFINKRFFYLVSFGTIAKYALDGIILNDHVVMFPIFFTIVLSIIAYILLHRFLMFVEALKQSYDNQLEGIVKGVITILELKDPYTRGHSERVAEYSMSLAKATGLFKDEDLKQFYYACLLHDIGKVNIPDAILSKPGKLTDEEYEEVKKHPVVGANALKDVEGIANCIDVILHHHERWDGKGYPNGLKGEETPLLARIIAIADAFDAMTSSRSYRDPLPFEEANKRILEGEGTQFDPNLVQAFQKVYPEWLDIHKQFQFK